MKKQKKIKRKYNFTLEKAKFIKSEFKDVKAYFEHTFGIYNRWIAQNTKGWTEEKEKHDKEIAEAALQKADEKTIDKMAAAMINFKEILFEILNDKDRVKNMNPKALKALWEILRTENGMPTRYIRSDVNNRNFNSDIPLTEEEKEKIKKALQEVGFE